MRTIIFLLCLVVTSANYAQTYTQIKVNNDLTLIKISDNAFVHISYTNDPKFGRFPSNGVVFISSKEAFLFDTPTAITQTKELVDFITDSLKLNVIGFIPNHWHNDCTGGLEYLKNIGVKTYANQLTIDILKGKGLPYPEVEFKDSLQLFLGDKEILCYYLGAAHSMDNIVVWIPSEKILFAGCMTKSTNSTNLGNTVDGDLKA
ncbi:MAG TPA: subclass B1 metallo-beta-lactamase CfiA4, partial [Tenuifilaceae bacterium]|nr:subclass B1 metallo-beta-lactamase CfiA4 [Tenuifilaceae bacterium]